MKRIHLDLEDGFPTGDGWLLTGAYVEGGHHLEVGDIVVGIESDDPTRQWVCGVVGASGEPIDRFYEVRRLRPTQLADGAWNSGHRRWSPTAQQRPGGGTRGAT